MADRSDPRFDPGGHVAIDPPAGAVVSGYVEEYDRCTYPQRRPALDLCRVSIVDVVDGEAVEFEVWVPAFWLERMPACCSSRYAGEDARRARGPRGR